MQNQPKRMTEAAQARLLNSLYLKCRHCGHVFNLRAELEWDQGGTFGNEIQGYIEPGDSREKSLGTGRQGYCPWCLHSSDEEGFDVYSMVHKSDEEDEEG
jgi:hypothetical protein